jgi:hypothetical protein
MPKQAVRECCMSAKNAVDENVNERIKRGGEYRWNAA